MLSPQQKLHFSSYSGLYDIVVPTGNLLRRINDLVDFRFICDDLPEKYCRNNGRTAESPVRMFKYLLPKTIYTVSDVDVAERSRYDMSFKYFPEMSPEEDFINPGSLTKFRKPRLKDMDFLNLLINKSVSTALEKGIIKSRSIIADATHTHSGSNPRSALEALGERSKLFKKAVFRIDEDYGRNLPEKNQTNDLDQETACCGELRDKIEKDRALCEIPAVREKLNLLKETVEDTREYYPVSKDEEAGLGHETVDSSLFGYKTRLAMTEERIITAAVVTSGERGDGPELPKLLEIGQQNGMQADTIIGDAAYSGKDNLRTAKEKNIDIAAKLNPAISQGCRKDQYRFHYSKDAGTFVCPAGRLAVGKARQGKKEQMSNQVETYRFEAEKCKICPFREGCCKPGSKTKSYSVSIKSELHEEQMAFRETEYYKLKSGERYKIEAKNSELKNVHGYGRADSYGVQNMEMQGASAIFTVNLKRILKLI